MMKDRRELFQETPKIDEVLQDEWLFFFMGSTPGAVTVDSVREVTGELRKGILEGRRSQIGTEEMPMTGIAVHTTDKKKKSLRRITNVTGVVLHTNLGRTNLSDKARESIMDVAKDYINLEYNVKRGSRGLRRDHMEKTFTKITGMEAIVVVNNNVVATMLYLSVLTKGKEVIVSRRELVKIRGFFQVPEITEQSGVRLADVGTINKTKPLDYPNAYHESETGALTKVHISNCRILGFTQEVELPEMAELDKKLNPPAIYDMGSGFMADLTGYGVDELTVLDALRTGIDMALFSGDKLLGGSQGGIIAEKKEYIGKMKVYPLARAFRVDRMTPAAMEATFFEYSDIRQARKATPVLDTITTPAAELKDKAERLAGEIRRTTHYLTIEVEACKDQVGGSSAPTVPLDGYAVAVQSRTLAPEKIGCLPRKGEIPIIIRITHNQVYLGVRTIREDESEYIAAAFTVMGSRQAEE